MWTISFTSINCMRVIWLLSRFGSDLWATLSLVLCGFNRWCTSAVVPPSSANGMYRYSKPGSGSVSCWPHDHNQWWINSNSWGMDVIMLLSLMHVQFSQNLTEHFPLKNTLSFWIIPDLKFPCGNTYSLHGSQKNIFIGKALHSPLFSNGEFHYFHKWNSYSGLAKIRWKSSRLNMITAYIFIRLSITRLGIIY